MGFALGASGDPGPGTTSALQRPKGRGPETFMQSYVQSKLLLGRAVGHGFSPLVLLSLTACWLPGPCRSAAVLLGAMSTCGARGGGAGDPASGGDPC